MTDTLLTEWGGNIRARRIKQGITLEEFAKKLDVSVPTVSRWETGVHEPRRHRKAQIAEALGTSPERLFNHKKAS